MQFPNKTSDLAVDLKATDIVTGLSIKQEAMNFTGEIKTLSVGKLEVLLSTIGELDTSVVKALLNDMFYYLIPFFNSQLEYLKVQIPKRIMGLFDLSDLQFHHRDHFLQIGATPKFVAPSGMISVAKVREESRFLQ